jgi:polar amino acid transport system substrate-binding protein
MSFSSVRRRTGKSVGSGKAWVLLAVMLMTAGIAVAGNRPVVFQSTDTPPYWSASLPDNGLGGSILNLVSTAAGVPYSIEYVPIKRFRQSLDTYIVGDPAILINQKQRAIFPIGVFRSAFFYYKPNHDVIKEQSMSALRGHTLGVLRGTLEDKGYFLSNGVNVEESDSIESLLRKLKRGRIDFCIMVAGSGRYTIKQLFPKEQNEFVQVNIPSMSRPIAIIIDVTDPEGRSVAQRYLTVMDETLRSRKYHDVLETYYGKDAVPGDQFEQLNTFVRYYQGTWDN